MRVLVGSRVSPSIKLYDSKEEASGGGFQFIRKILAPHVIITDDEGRTIYEYGERTSSIFPFIALGVLAVVAWKVL